MMVFSDFLFHAKKAGSQVSIFDSTLRERSEFDTTLGSVVPTKFLVGANSLEELAAKFGIPSDVFLKPISCQTIPPHFPPAAGID